MDGSKQIYRVCADITSPSQSGLYGFLEQIDITGISGWLLDIDSCTDTIVACLQGRPVASGGFDVWRQDLVEMTGQSRAYGFHLRWLQGNIENLQIDPDEDVPLIFQFSHHNFIFSNRPEISGKEILKIYEKLVSVPEQRDSASFRKEFEAAAASGIATEHDVKLIAWYLPQYYPDPDNQDVDSSWLKTVQARPLFPDHDQPHFPGELGFTDPRVDETRLAQAKLAAEYGIYGFCLQYSWSKGRKKFVQPIKALLRCGQPKFPFCICWDNGEDEEHNDGGSEAVEEAKMCEALIEDIIPILLDPRYIRINDAPLLPVMYPSRLADPFGTAIALRQACARYGIQRVHLCAVDGNDPTLLGFDSACRLPPFFSCTEEQNIISPEVPSDFTGKIFSYASLVRQELHEEPTAYTLFPSVMCGWDSTPGKGKSGDAFLGVTAKLYEIWLRGAIDRARKELSVEQRFVFINAWNDWLNGASLEPDAKCGRSLLAATRRALGRQTDWRELLEYLRMNPDIDATAREGILSDVERQIASLAMQVEWYEKIYDTPAMPGDCSGLKQGLPQAVSSLPVVHAGSLTIDQINNQLAPELALVNQGDRFRCAGWCVSQGIPVKAATPTWLLLIDADDDTVHYHAFISRRRERADIADHFHALDVSDTWFSGFDQMFTAAGVAKGVYRLGLLTLGSRQAMISANNTILEVE